MAKRTKKVYSELTTDHPIDLCRYQVANCYMGRIGLINSGGASSGASDMAEAVTHGRDQQARRWPRPHQWSQGVPTPVCEGIALLNAIQDVYLDKGSP
jgi:class I fructose-bisphosphate aldolase